jgi:23S rRNA (cytosine1962-C5)-methyltransferase
VLGGGGGGGGPGWGGGGLVTVVDGRGIPLGTALYSDASEICLRMVSREAGVGRAGYLGEVRDRLEAAIRLREAVVAEAFGGVSGLRPTHDDEAVMDGAPEHSSRLRPTHDDEAVMDGAPEHPGALRLRYGGKAVMDGGPGPLVRGERETNACRLVFSEADGLPGIVIDRYAGLVVAQLLTQGTAQEDVRAALVEVLARQAWVETVVERPDARVRELERLSAEGEKTLFVRGGAGAEAVLQTTFTINGVRFHFDAGAGQKTGAFLDQRLNYAAAAKWAATGKTGRALDVCTYQGGFALHLAGYNGGACERVTGVDASRASLEVADRNLELNAERMRAKVDWMEADAFELLRDYEAAGERFGTIVLDPPAFAKSKRAAEGALRGYKELNLRAIKMIEAGGTLVTCSCSHHVGLEEFMGVVRAAAEDAVRRVQLLEVRGAAPDHPAVLTLPETSYLKCLICRVG